MDNKVNRITLFNHLFAFILLFPVIFSFLFALLRLSVPSYLFIIIVTIAVLPLIGGREFSLSLRPAKTWVILLLLWILSSLLYTESVFAAQEKALAIIYNTVIPILLIEFFFLRSRSKRIDEFSFRLVFRKYSYILIWISFVAFIFFHEKGLSDRYTLMGISNPIWFSRFVGMLALIIVGTDKPMKKNALIYFSSLGVALILMFSTGSRGPLVAAVVTFLLMQSFIFSKKQVLLATSIVGLFIFLGFTFVGGYLFETNFYSLYARLDLIKIFMDFEIDYIKGGGIGSYSLMFMGEDVVYYPHNIFLELFLENGLIGVILFCIILGFFIRAFKPNILYFLAFYYLLVSLPSGDIPGNNNLFILLYATAFAPEVYARNESKDNFGFGKGAA